MNIPISLCVVGRGGVGTGAGSPSERAALQAFVSARVAKVEGGYYCTVCGTTIRHVNNVKRHVVIKHGDQVGVDCAVAYQCPACAAQLRSRISMQSHLAAKHPQLKGLDLKHCEVRLE